MASVRGTTRRRASLDNPPNISSEPSLRMLVFGSSSHQISLTQSVLGRDVFTRDEVNISATKKSSRVVQERKITLVNTPNLQENVLPDSILHKELRKAICFSCPGPHAAVLVVDPFHLTFDSMDMLKPVVHYFGEHILKHTLIVLYHEKDMKTLSIEDEVKKNKSFRELAEKCSQNYLFFNEEANRTEGSQTQALLTKVDEMVLEHGIFSNVEFKDAEKRIQIEERYIRKSKEKESREMLKMLENQHSGEALISETLKYEEEIQLECREKAELVVADKLGFTGRFVDYAAAVGKGAFVGALLGFAAGYEGMAVGAAIGAGLGAWLGGATNAAWSYIYKSFTDAH
ncbi:GTPase IMAP family member 7 [Labeo rohita]|uniref:GTPase IMAP family member 7 n=1 Tax=Labeo rohita TaxID=84645 RepID=UPI0021E2F8EE|nr:GTPase IMAP family member 7 [Labeo rohita]XP_050962410.1 GTPase IMAP family member 7 [Labeo rohita]XP_050962412.1 GTPase IMAP family member 7 [Labeo rohita]XP_050962413.1 GTPase IMAP family member 7 [Labeo rohita]XP_050962414.1 GTPase IMAP family member 7 [Labeo rohita]